MYNGQINSLNFERSVLPSDNKGSSNKACESEFHFVTIDENSDSYTPSVATGQTSDKTNSSIETELEKLQKELESYKAANQAPVVKKDEGDLRKTPQEKMAMLNKAEAQVYSKYYEMTDKLTDDKKLDATINFINGLTDKELNLFVKAYDFVNSENGGIMNLSQKLLTGILNKSIDSNSVERFYKTLSDNGYFKQLEEDIKEIEEQVNKKAEQRN